MKKRKVLGLLLAAVMASSLIACGGNNKEDSTAQVDNTGSNTEENNEADNQESESKESEDSGEEVTLTVLAGQSTTDAGIEDMIDEALAEKYPEITLEWECVDWGNDFQPKMQQYLQSGLPDIMIGKAQDVATYAPQGVLGEIDSTYLDKGLDAARENVTVDGKTYGLVYNAMYQGVYYNKAMFAENNWEIPKTQEDLQKIIDDCNAKGITPFGSHMVDTWSIGNVTMQFMMNDVFHNDAEWGDKFRAGEVSFSDSKEAQTAYEYNKLIFEPNITIMTSAESEHQDAINKVLDVLTSDKELAVEILDYTKTASMLKDVTPTFPNPSQEDIDQYAADGMIVDVTLGNNQLIWGGFQEENAKDIAAWLQGDETFEECLKASDDRVEASSAN